MNEVVKENFLKPVLRVGPQNHQQIIRDFPSNYLDRRETYRLLFPINSLTCNFSLAKTRCPPFVEGQMNRVMFAAAPVYGMARYYLEGDPNNASLDKGMVVGIGEVLAPGLPDDLWLEEGAARVKCISVVRRLMQTNQAFALMGINPDRFVERADAQYQFGPEYHLPIGDAAWATVPLPVESAMKLLIYVASEFLNNNPNLPQKMLVVMLVATLKKGCVTDPFLHKIPTGMRTELGLELQISHEVIKDTSRAYISYMSSDIARIVVQRWREAIPESALRLRLTVTQAVGEGLTGYNTVRRAVTALPSFPWATLQSISIYGAEMEAFIRASDEIGDDEFYGFNRDLAAVGIRNYKNLASACAALIARALGDDHIQSARCFTQAYAYADRVNRLINDFVNQEPNPHGAGGRIRMFIEADGTFIYPDEDYQN